MNQYVNKIKKLFIMAFVFTISFNVLASDNLNKKQYQPRNQFRVELEFGLKGGNDTLRGAIFKEDGQYGDIVNLIDTDNIYQAYYHLYKVNGDDRLLIVVLPDRSNLRIFLTQNLKMDDAIFKMKNKVILYKDIYYNMKIINQKE